MSRLPIAFSLRQTTGQGEIAKPAENGKGSFIVNRRLRASFCAPQNDPVFQFVGSREL
jgi:hypothetical protein